MSNDINCPNIHPFNPLEDREIRYNSRSLIKRGTFSYGSNEANFVKLNSIRENAMENESSLMKQSIDSLNNSISKKNENLHTQ
jgi:hypothetical protein